MKSAWARLDLNGERKSGPLHLRDLVSSEVVNKNQWWPTFVIKCSGPNKNVAIKRVHALQPRDGAAFRQLRGRKSARALRLQVGPMFGRNDPNLERRASKRLDLPADLVRGRIVFHNDLCNRGQAPK